MRTRNLSVVTEVASLPPPWPGPKPIGPKLRVYPLTEPENPCHMAVWMIARAMERMPDPVLYPALIFKVATICHLGVDDARAAVDCAIATPAFRVEPAA